MARAYRHETALLAMKAEGLWDGSFNGKESTLQQLSPYVGKLKSGMVHSLIEYFTQTGDRVCDPFSGSEVVAESTLVALVSSNISGVAIRQMCRLNPVAGSNYATGTVVVEGRRLNSRAEIRASVNGGDAMTHVTVVTEPDMGIQFKISLVSEDLGKFRAMWGDREGKPHLLKVSARHRSLARYLGPPPDYDGQNAPHFRVLLAEIVAEAVCRKTLLLESKERTWEFRWADSREDHLIADDVLSSFQERVRDFVADAHAIMLSDAEVKRATKPPWDSGG
ncbi:MAG: hypothetical protein HY673_13710 [Chloroflexi bacterium]|nr:hypothetical protein [Chloroflexota bacterium]